MRFFSREEGWKIWDVERVENGDNQEREFHSQMSQIEGMVIGLEAGEGGRHVVYHFSLGGNEDVTRIHTKKQSCPCCFVHIPGVVLLVFRAARQFGRLRGSFSFLGFCNCAYSQLFSYDFNCSFGHSLVKTLSLFAPIVANAHLLPLWFWFQVMRKFL